MKKLTMFFTLFAVTLTSGIGLASCDDDADQPSSRIEQVNPAKVFTAGLPKGFDDWLIVYDAAGRVIRFDYKKSSDYSQTVEYPMEGKMAAMTSL